MKLQFITIILAVVTLYSCGSSNNNGITDTTNSTNNPTTPTTNAITNSFWQLITLEGKNIPIKNNGEQKVGFTDSKTSSYKFITNRDSSVLKEILKQHYDVIESDF